MDIKLSKSDLKELVPYVNSVDDIKVILLDSETILDNLKKTAPIKYENLKDCISWISLELSYEKTTIRYTGYGPELYSAFYMAKDSLLNYLKNLEKEISEGTIEVETQKLH